MHPLLAGVPRAAGLGTDVVPVDSGLFDADVFVRLARPWFPRRVRI